MLFQGTAMRAIDADGRIELPEFIAGAMGAGVRAGTIMLSKAAGDRCLTGFSRSHLETLQARIERRRAAAEADGGDEAEHRRRSRRTFALMEDTACIDGRMTLPPGLARLGGLNGKLALFVGAGETFEIWDPELAIASGEDEFSELAAYRLAEHRAAHEGVRA